MEPTPDETPLAPPKPGFATSEFWGLPAVLAAIPLDPGNAHWYVAAYSAYCLSRALTKIFG